MAKRARPNPGRADRKTRRPEPELKDGAPARPAPAPRTAPLLPDHQAVSLFERGMAALQRHAYQPAAEAFQALIDRFPGERALLERTRVYLELCQREMKRRPADPRTLEERLTAATAALNNGDEDQAERLLKAILADHAKHDLGLYLMAAVEARRGNAEAALSYLSQAVDISPEISAQARHDVDFEMLRGTDLFHTLVDGPLNASGTRRRRTR